MGGLGAYVVVVLLVAIGWAGVPAIGGAVIAGAAVLASQGKLDFGGVLVASILATEAGGLAGYAIGIRWGRALLNHPGPGLDRRQRALSAGEALYDKWEGHGPCPSFQGPRTSALLDMLKYWWVQRGSPCSTPGGKLG